MWVLAELESGTTCVGDCDDPLRSRAVSAHDTDLLDSVVGLSEDGFDTVVVHESNGTNDASISVGWESDPCEVTTVGGGVPGP